MGKTKPAAGLAYLGEGEFIPGIPARNLTPEEVERYRDSIEDNRRNASRPLYGPLPAEPVALVEDGADG